MQFSAFLDKLQRMFNIFEEENEEVSEQANVCMLLKKVEHPQLQDAVGALQVCAAIEGISFTECANHLSAQVSELPMFSFSKVLHNKKIHPILLDLQLKCKSQRKKHTPSLASMIQAILPSFSIIKMTLLNPTLQPQFSTYSRHRLAFL
jgi:hypothetical protein